MDILIQGSEPDGVPADLSGERPAFHLTPASGWMNDPNGFSFYNKEYHLFFQHDPSAPRWGRMHWGHAVSRDLVKWKHLPVALAPDRPYDADGCYSGSAALLPDGRQLLMYTGVASRTEPSPAGGPAQKGEARSIQTQCLAIGDGRRYEKYAGNPVIGADLLPPDTSVHDFRDPCLIPLRDGSFAALAVTCDADGRGQVLQFRSRDGFSWTWWNRFLANDGSLGRMWECPDLFPLDGRWILLLSAVEMEAVEGRYPCGHGTIVLVGDFDEKTGIFHPEFDQPLDCGLDFYAAQTTLSPEGRRIMVGWMQNWACTGMRPASLPWAGQMSFPRELFLRGGRLCQRPVRELAQYYGNTVLYKNVPVSGEVVLYGVEGRTVDLEITVRPAPDEPLYHRFAVHFAAGQTHYTSVEFFPSCSTVRIDRRYSGTRQALAHAQTCRVGGGEDGSLRMRLLLDRFSCEVFLNDGERVMTAVFYTGLSAESISFLADGRAVIDVTKKEIRV